MPGNLNRSIDVGLRSLKQGKTFGYFEGKASFLRQADIRNANKQLVNRPGQESKNQLKTLRPNN